MTSLVLCMAFLLLEVGKVQGRFSRLESISEVLVSDGVDHLDNPSTIILGSDGLSSSSSETCHHYYGFFPCADNVAGYIFQILIYQYLLVVGEKFLTKGSKRLFNVFGTGIFGAIIFRILMVLPGVVVVLISGLSKNKESAQSSMVMGVGMLAGRSVFRLTLQWGACVIFGRKEIQSKSSTSQDSQPSTSKCLLVEEKLSHLTGSGITTDNKTSYTAGFMLLSLIPFTILQLSNIFETSSGSRVVILIALIVSVLLLLSSFAYQVYDPWIQERSLEYMKYEHLLLGFMQHVQRHAKGKLVTEEGEPNIPEIRRLFNQIDRDADRYVKPSDMADLMLQIQTGNVQLDNEFSILDAFRAFDLNKDEMISEEEFIKGCEDGINRAKELVECGGPKARKSFQQVVQPWIDKRRLELTKIECIMARILKHAHYEVLEARGLLTQDGRPNLDHIKSLFKQLDKSNDGLIEQSELKELIQNITFGTELNHNGVVAKVMKEFDEDGNLMIDEREFVDGIKKWINEAVRVSNCKDSERFIDEFDQITWKQWKEVDSLVYEVEKKEGIINTFLSWDCMKAVLLVILGIAIVTFLAGPLVDAVYELSVSVRIPTFFISFVVIPLALNARVAASAIFPASQKNLKIASLTFSEIYGGVGMNNIMTLSTFLAVIYMKGLTWDYSSEVLVVLVVCAIIGLLAFLRSTYPLWTCILAFFLYPFSLVLVYVLRYVCDWN
ncbi:sodium/calcium exchanger NCL1-like isoform X1 [Cornus florida]|uniref:sodium/calcium exchanger NCL1-like isoform X1 n=1 Tax=Cornus florida TaxID=4283 RepID=UPI00289B8495|nr:sodium/calcium exchanger NCL1-like isoform X1 [Cornus florida]